MTPDPTVPPFVVETGVNWATVALAVIAAIPPTLAALAAFIKTIQSREAVSQIAERVNGQMDRLAEKAAEADYVRGELDAHRAAGMIPPATNPPDEPPAEPPDGP